ncbi:MAG: alpha/beta fold hydrolase [Solirubrobacteraceae bacterium]|nr:alpha/beta fold hydrolase [Solirubrobacteraceae bacterium]
MPVHAGLRRLILTAVLGVSALAAPAALASPYAKGPDPTAAEVAKPFGPYAVDELKVPNSASPDFGPATIFAPKAPAGTTFGVVGVSPGFLAEQWTLTWLARRVASQGFVTVVFTPNSLTATPVQRSRALSAALEFTTTQSAAKALTDPSRLAVIGHSMGGGAALEATRRDATLKASVAIAPWSQWKSFDAVATPTMVLGFKPDWIAPVAKHAKPFYASLAPSLPKAYLELNLDHALPSLVPVSEVSRATVNWLKRFVDDDERYTQALCPAVTGVKTATITGYESSCGDGPLAP